MPKVSIIILNWKQPELTVNCVKSVLKQDYDNFEIILIDNHSEDHSFETLKNIFGKNKKIRLFQTEKNIGYAGGNNFGVKKCKGEYVVILNNDTVVDENWLKELVIVIKSDAKIGAVSSVEYFHGKNPGKSFFRTATSSILGYPAHSDKVFSKDFLVDSFSVRGSSFIFRKNCCDYPFDNDYFAYGEDLFFGWFLNLKGYVNKTNLNSIIFHMHNTVKLSDSKFRKKLEFLGERNRILNILTLYSSFNIIKILPLLMINVVFINIFDFFRAKQRLKAYIWILKHLDVVHKKRYYIQSKRIVSDNIIISRMSCKLIDCRKINQKFLIFVRVANLLFFVYCFVFRIKTIEFR